MPLIPTLGRQRQRQENLYVFKASLVYRANSRKAKTASQRNRLNTLPSPPQKSIFHNGISGLTHIVKEKLLGGWRDGSEVKSTDCSSRGPEFNSQQPHGGLQPSVMRSGALFWHASIHGRNVVDIINK